MKSKVCLIIVLGAALWAASAAGLGGVASADPLPLPSNAPIVFNPGGTPFDPTLSADLVEPVGGHSGTNTFDTLTPPTYEEVDLAHAVGSLLSGVPGQAVDIADGTAGGVEPRPGLRVGWTAKFLLNLPGPDLVIAEAGSWAGAEYYLIVVKPSGAEPTNFYYEPPEAFEGIEDKGTVGELDPEDTGHFLNAFDLSAMGIAEGATIEYLEIYKVLAVDTFADGLGYVGCGEDVPLVPEALDSNAPGPIAEGRYDADIVYVFATDADRLVDAASEVEVTIESCMPSLVTPAATVESTPEATGTPKP